MADFNDWTTFQQQGENYNYIKGLQALAKQQTGEAEGQGSLMLGLGLEKVPEAVEKLKKGYEAFGQLKEQVQKLPQTIEEVGGKLGDIAEKHLSALDEGVESAISKVGNIGEMAINKGVEKLSDIGSSLGEGRTFGESLGDTVRNIRDTFTTLRTKPNTLHQQLELDPEDISGHLATSRHFNLFNDGQKSIMQKLEPEQLQTQINKFGEMGAEGLKGELGNLQKTAGEISEQALKEGMGIGQEALSSLKTLGEEGLGALKTAGAEAGIEAISTIAPAVGDFLGPVGVLADVGLGLYSLIKGTEHANIPSLPIPSLQIH